ncbi:sulfatase [Sungkyunkwania multivorans]|uniref:Sulfatase n=1 Tax=Sungkyunkwania multivorans TaxID=1173618 RepID=A0ABW3CUN0_9FLAO
MKNPHKIVASILLIVLSIACKERKKDDFAIHEDTRPNIIFLLTDDQRWDAIGYAGNTVLKTPNIDTLAKDGVYFKNAYVTTSICAVSRASILTGQYARRHKIWGFSKNFTEEQLDNTYPLLLRRSGYYIGFIGKYGVGNQLPVDKYDYWKGFEGQGTFDQKDRDGNATHLTDMIGKQATEFLELQRGLDKPFCLSVSFKAPHVEGDPGVFLPNEAYAELYEDATIDIPKTSTSEYFEYFPSNFTTNNVARNRWEDRFSTSAQQQESIKKYYRLIHGVDVVVGEILKKLKETGQDKNTVIIYTSDNGFYLGEYGFAGKWYGSEASIRVPMIINDPRSKVKGTVIDKKVLNIDVAPTILSIAAVEAPKMIQGEDLTKLMADPDTEWRDSFFYEHLWKSSNDYYIPSTEGVVSGDKKYMKYFMNRDTTDVIFEELYELSKDPFETNNLMGNQDAKMLEQAMREKYWKLKKLAE